VTLRLEHDRGSLVYRATVLTDRLDHHPATVEVNATQWCVRRSEIVCQDALDRRLFELSYGRLVPGNIGCHWIAPRVHRLDPPCDSAVARDLTGPNGPWP
jgi:hypothetical protein